VVNAICNYFAIACMSATLIKEPPTFQNKLNHEPNSFPSKKKVQTYGLVFLLNHERRMRRHTYKKLIVGIDKKHNHRGLG
jgi:hypothetical protein